MSNCQKNPVPFGGGVAKIFRIGIQPVNGQIGAYYNVEKPDLIFSDKSSHHRAVQSRKAESAPHNTFTHVPELLNPDFKAVKSPDIRLGVSNMDSFHGSLFTQGYFYLVIYSKFAENKGVMS